MKKIVYFLLSIIGIFYIFSLSALVVVPNIADLGWWGQALFYLNRYGGAAIVFVLATVNFSGNVFKIILNILLILVTILYVVATIIPEQIADILGIVI